MLKISHNPPINNFTESCKLEAAEGLSSACLPEGEDLTRARQAWDLVLPGLAELRKVDELSPSDHRLVNAVNP